MSGIHPPSTGPRCGAQTRKGTPCQTPAVAGMARCRMHGGSASSGAPKGNWNALKHGQYTAEARAFEAHVRKVLRESLEEGSAGPPLLSE